MSSSTSVRKSVTVESKRASVVTNNSTAFVTESTASSVTSGSAELRSKAIVTESKSAVATKQIPSAKQIERKPKNAAIAAESKSTASAQNQGTAAKTISAASALKSENKTNGTKSNGEVIFTESDSTAFKEVFDFIWTRNLISNGDRVGVGVSGGSDSMALLHFLHSNQSSLGCEIVAVNVNHNIRPSSRKDSRFVAGYCKDNNIKYVGLNADVPAFAAQEKLGTEQAARIKRFECFETAIKKLRLTKFALAHHASDQAETILLHIFRGSGIGGASGMEPQRGLYIRPFLETAKTDIASYIYKNRIPYVQDETNLDNSYARNFLRNEVIPLLKREWRNVEKNILNFGANCRTDNQYLNGLINNAVYTKTENNVRIPLNYFAYPDAVVSRLIINAIESISAWGANGSNIEKKHIDMICALARDGQNGSRIDLPNSMHAIREYECITIIKKAGSIIRQTASFKAGKTSFGNFGTIIVSKTISFKQAITKGLMVIDTEKLPRTAKWRTRNNSDTFTKFGGGTKPLSAYLIDKKVPARLRDKIPVLADGNNILAIAGIEISDKVKTDETTVEAYILEFVKD